MADVGIEETAVLEQQSKKCGVNVSAGVKPLMADFRQSSGSEKDGHVFVHLSKQELKYPDLLLWSQTTTLNTKTP